MSSSILQISTLPQCKTCIVSITQVDSHVTCGPVRIAELRSSVGINLLNEEDPESPSVFQLPISFVQGGEFKVQHIHEILK